MTDRRMNFLKAYFSAGHLRVLRWPMAIALTVAVSGTVHLLKGGEPVPPVQIELVCRCAEETTALNQVTFQEERSARMRSTEPLERRCYWK